MRRSTMLSAVVLAAGMFVLSGCGSGQTAHTAEQDSTIVGVNTRSANGNIAVRDAYVKFAREYAAGSNAPLVLRLFNESSQLVTLTGVTAEGGTVVVVSKVAPTTAPPPPPATPSASASPNGSRRPTGSASASVSGSPTSAAPTTPPALGSPNISIPIPPQSFVVLMPGESDRWLAVDKLSEPVESGGSVTVTLTFTLADGSTDRVTDLRMPVGVPFSPGPRLTPSAAEEH